MAHANGNSPCTLLEFSTSGQKFEANTNVIQWVCSRCARRLLYGRKPFLQNLRDQLEDAKSQTKTRPYGTAVPDRPPNIAWQDWFDSAAPYIPSVSGAAFNDRQRRSHHGRDWTPPVRLQASFAPQLEVAREEPMFRPKPKKAIRRPPIVMVQPVQLKDESWVLETFDYPTKEDYPLAPEELFEPPSFEAMVHAFKKVRPRHMKIVTRDRVIRPDSETESFWRRLLLVRFGDKDSFTLVGEGYTLDEARKAALMHLIAVLHDQERLYQVKEMKNTEESAPQGLSMTMSRWAAKLHVYNFAARFGTIPEFSRQTRRVGSADGIRITVTVSNPSGPTLHGTATGVNALDTELLACMELKRKAEDSQASADHKRLDLQGHEAVNIDNAPTVLAAYRTIDPTCKLTFEHSLKFHSSVKVWSFQAFLNDQHLGQAIEYRWLDEGLRLSKLVAAVTLVQQNGNLMDVFRNARGKPQGLTLPRTTPIETPGIDPISDFITATVEQLRNRRLADPRILPVDNHQPRRHANGEVMTSYRSARAREYAHRHRISKEARSQNLYLTHEYYMINPAIEEMRQERLELPMNHNRERILNLVDGHAVSIVVGATASGKSTQVPQIILEEAIRERRGADCNIICTQPRRIAAKALAHRVAAERDEVLGEVIGYQLGGGEIVASELGGSITYSTPELQNVLLENFPDEMLDGTSHFIIDEVHQRDETTDRMLALLKQAMVKRREANKPMPRIILMSATLQKDLFEEYFSFSGSDHPPSVEISGRIFPVQELYLDDILGQVQSESPGKSLKELLNCRTSEFFIEQEQGFSQRQKHREAQEHGPEDSETSLIQWESRLEADSVLHETPFGLTVATIAHILKSTFSGDVLVFLPGIAAIQVTKKLLENHGCLRYNVVHRHHIVVLHAMNSAGIDEATAQPKAPGERKILLSTDIAETSLTLENVEYVVDSGLRRDSVTHPLNGVMMLDTRWISQANATQRAGRAGRVRPGRYYALFSKERRASFAPTSRHHEYGSLDLMRGALRVKKFTDQAVHGYFSETLNPPSPDGIDLALERLRNMGAMSELNNMTMLGEILSNSVVNPLLSMQVYMGALFRCLEPMIVIAAALEMDSIFVYPEDAHMRRRVKVIRNFYAQNTLSDHVVLLNAYREVRKVRKERGEERAKEWAANNFIDYQRFENIDRQVNSLQKIVLNTVAPHEAWDKDAYNVRSEDNVLIQALLVAGNYSNVATHEHGNIFATPIGVEAAASDMSLAGISYQASRREPGTSNTLENRVAIFSRWFRLDDNSSIIGNITPVSPLALVLFSGKVEPHPEADDILIMDDWLNIRVPGEGAAKAALELRDAWDRVWWSGVREFARGPLAGIAGSRDVQARDIFLQDVVDLLHLEDGGFKVQPLANNKNPRLPMNSDGDKDPEKLLREQLLASHDKAGPEPEEDEVDKDEDDEFGVLPHEA